MFSTVFSTVVEIFGEETEGVWRSASSRPEMSSRLYHIVIDRDPALTRHFCDR
jgi:hypothetical protein